MNDDTTRQVAAQARVFGFEPTEVALDVLPRSPAWRGIRAGAFAGGGVALAPVLGLIPPHVAWILASIVTGGFLGWRKWAERFTLVEVTGRCPKCEGELELDATTRLRAASTMGCPECRHDVQIVVDDDVAL